MRKLFLAAASAALIGVGLASAEDCKFCAPEIVIRASQLDCLKQRIDQATREIGDKQTVLIDLLSCGRPGGGSAAQTQAPPSAPAPVEGAPQAPAQVYRLTRAGLQCVQQRLGSVPPGQDPIRLSTICS